MSGLLLENVSVGYDTRRGTVRVVDEVSLTVERGRTLGIVGESGSGKTTLARALTRHLPRSGRILDGRIDVDGRDLLALSAAQLRDWRRGELAVVHQEAGGTLDPSMRVGDQLAEVLSLQGIPNGERGERVRQLLQDVQLPDPAQLARRYPHELSGGQQQRVVIAAALATRPSLLILDEPTTGLDASVEAEILALLADLRSALDATVVLISHDLGLVGALCDDIAVLYAGRVVEQGPAEQVLRHPRHPYTAALLTSAPQLGVPRSVRRLTAIPGSPPNPAALPTGCRFAPRCAFADATCRAGEPAERSVDGQLVRCHHADSLGGLLTAVGSQPAAVVPQREGGPRLRVRGLTRQYGDQPVVDQLDLDIGSAEVFGLVGESGSGKTTLARALLGIGPAGGTGTIALDGTELPVSVRRRDPATRRRVQLVFQQPDATLNPAQRVRTVLARAVRTLRGKDDPATLATHAQLDPALLDERTTSLSGGQKQRVAIARAFAGDPDLVVCDEPVSALDASVQAGVLEVLADQRDRTGTSYLFISHDLAVVGYLADRVGVMYRGELVEVGDTEDVLGGRQHPYTASLVAAADGRFARPVADPARLGAGCRFADRCPFYLGTACTTEHPELRTGAAGHAVRCHLPLDDLPVKGNR